MKKPEILALIPARGGSKGVPRKNILELAGQPLISYSIQHGLQSAYVTRTIVSTDDAEIADVARAWGAEVPFLRPAEIAGDMATDLECFAHTLTWLKETQGYVPELVVHLRPTGPVRKVVLMDQAIEQILAAPEADSLRSVAPAPLSPFKMWRIEDGRLKPLLDVPGIKDPQSMPRQILPMTYWQNGYVDIIRPRTILEMGMMTGRVVLPFLVDEPIYEIDYPESIPVVADALERMKRGEDLTPPKDDVIRHPV